jgi:hypothetical protein
VRSGWAGRSIRPSRGLRATGLKALTSPESEGSVAFQHRLGFSEMVTAEDYGGSGRTRIVMRKSLT